MSDVSKTNELITDLRIAARSAEWLADEMLMNSAADALEAKTGVRVDMSSAVDVETQLAATRVPVQGEPNDDRESLEDEHDGLEALYEAGEISFAVALDRARSVGTALATVPDAATENVQKMYDRACADIQEYSETIKRLQAERDSALAAIERLRAIHRPVEIEPSSTICGECSFKLPNGRYFGKVEEWPCPTIAALDGAPEPEWQESRGILHSNGLLEVGSTLPAGRLVKVRRRKAGPWLPVEGEKP